MDERPAAVSPGRGLENIGPTCILTFDVEDYFQVENLRPVFPAASWEEVARRVTGTTRRILDLLSEHEVRATFFVLGWIAEHEPALVREIAERGHEIASHGHTHVLPTRLTLEEFRADVCRARDALEDLTGVPVVGYRAPSFALTPDQLRLLARCGYRYDSSVNPFAFHDRYSRFTDLGDRIAPGVYRLPDGLIELELSVARLGPFAVPIAGGGYFRLYPGALFRRFIRSALLRDGHYLMYLHPWEWDSHQPRVSGLGMLRHFRHYNNLARTFPRLRELMTMLRDGGVAFLTASELLQRLDPQLAAAQG